jgi:23S rRNA (guanosine2251-2'-O)-methyltransferase
MLAYWYMCGWIAVAGSIVRRHGTGTFRTRTSCCDYFLRVKHYHHEHRSAAESINDALGSHSTEECCAPLSLSPAALQLRRDVLRRHLTKIGMDADGLEEAARRSLMDSTLGFDDRFGRSAIRTCLSFYYPKKDSTAEKFANDPFQLEAAGARTARQIEFLSKRHVSHQTEWIRHHDSPDQDSGAAVLPRQKRFPLILLLDNLRSAHNVGSLFRTADAAGCAQVITVGITPHPFGNGAEKLRKSALGAELTVPSRHFATMNDALDYLKAGNPHEQFQLVGMETTAQSVIYTNLDYVAARGVVLVLGNEVTGVDANAMSRLDAIVEIPMFGTKNSLNVAACAPIVLYEIVRQWTSKST